MLLIAMQKGEDKNGKYYFEYFTDKKYDNL